MDEPEHTCDLPTSTRRPRRRAGATTPAVRQEIQASSESLKVLAARYRINPKTVDKWRKRSGIDDASSRPKRLRPPALSKTDEAIILSVRRRTMLPLDDCLYALQATIPYLTRSALYRCFLKHGVTTLPRSGSRSKRTMALGRFSIARTWIPTATNTLQLFQATDLASKLVFGQIYDQEDTQAAERFLSALINGVPYAASEIRYDASLFKKSRNAASEFQRVTRLCERSNIQLRERKERAPHRGANSTGDLRRLHESGVKSPKLRSKKQVIERYFHFLHGYNFSRRLKRIGGLTPYQATCKLWIPTTHQVVLKLNRNFGRVQRELV